MKYTGGKKALRAFSILWLVLLLAICLFPFPAFAEEDIDGDTPTTTELPTELACPAYVLMDVHTGEVVLDRNAAEKMYPASTSKLITALLFVEAFPDLKGSYTLGNEIVIKDKAASMAGFEVGQTVSYKDLLYGLLLPSGNDAANAIAVVVDGSQEKFCQRINERFQQLGMANSHFTNPSGMPDENHYTTAYDMALLAKACLENPTIMEVCTTLEYTLPANGRHPNGNKVRNSNALVQQLDRSGKKNTYYYPAATGLKTGYTNAAGNCLVASAQVEDRALIAVLLGDTTSNTTRWQDAASLFDYGFYNTVIYPLREAVEKLEVVGSIPGGNGHTLALDMEIPADYPTEAVVKKSIADALDNPQADGVDITLNLAPSAKAPIEKGQVVGSVVITVQGEEILRCNVTSPRFLSDIQLGWPLTLAIFFPLAFLLMQLTLFLSPLKKRRMAHGRR
ncbi:D-alanyl-D-alanine carboxypeptidase [Eubacteriales bacterium OttesenSCG-928-M02]|nr:D-alanyl-D-alanine carboxypeptidase [Eubacteriales bacterium OttesenSCG-928-M02]